MKRDNDIKSVIEEIDSLSKLIKESYVYEEEPSMEYEEPIDGENAEHQEEEIAKDNLQSDDRIGEIRKLALDGIQEYAMDVDTIEYDTFKKIWLLCDKICSEKDATTK